MIRVKVAPGGFCSLAHPLAEPGETPSGAVVFLVKGVPPGTPAGDVVRRFEGAVIWTAGGRYVVRFDELGPGRLCRP